MPANDQVARRHVRHRKDRQEATLQAFLAIEEMFDSLDSQLKHSAVSRLKFGEARRKLGHYLHAEIVRPGVAVDHDRTTAQHPSMLSRCRR